MKITVEFLEEQGMDSVTDYCRYLMEHWDYPCPYHPDEKIEVYRGDMLCYTVSSIKWGASMKPNPRGGFIKYNAPRIAL